MTQNQSQALVNKVCSTAVFPVDPMFKEQVALYITLITNDVDLFNSEGKKITWYKEARNTDHRNIRLVNSIHQLFLKYLDSDRKQITIFFYPDGQPEVYHKPVCLHDDLDINIDIIEADYDESDYHSRKEFLDKLVKFYSHADKYQMRQLNKVAKGDTNLAKLVRWCQAHVQRKS